MAYIQLDCPPFTPRPDEYLPGVLSDTGLTPDDFEVTSAVFGCWTFELKDGYQEKLKIMQDKIGIIKGRIRALYEQGAIRYGAWEI